MMEGVGQASGLKQNRGRIDQLSRVLWRMRKPDDSTTGRQLGYEMDRSGVVG